MAKAAGWQEVACPSLEAAMVREAIGADMVNVKPEIRPPDSGRRGSPGCGQTGAR
jgi:orotidine-5'-phosphate decarboxylase